MPADMRFETDNVKGGVVMIAAVGALSLMDAGMKVLSGVYPPLQVAAIRALASLPLIVTWIAFTGGFAQLRRVRIAFHLLRGALGIAMLAAFIFGVRHVPLAEAYTIFFIAPLLITAFSVPLLGERVELRRWLAIAGGLVGVLIVLRPTATGLITAGGVAVMGSAVAYALSAITVRILGRTDSTQSMVFWLMTIVGAGAGLLALPRWRAIQSEHWLIIAAIGAAGFLGQWAITEAFRIGEPSFIASFEYTALAWGLGLDWVLFRTLPGMRTFAGAAVIIACGAYLIQRERRVAKAPSGHAPTGDLVDG
jgi:drug/metabolite transporter (DMT)-like permease